MHIFKIIASCLLVAFLYFSCQTSGVDLKEKAKQEIVQSEKDFLKMTTDQGIKIAFPYYADTNAVVKGDKDSLIKGKTAIGNFYSSSAFTNATLTWSPDFVDASEDGNFGYTYGNYVWKSKDSTGKVSEFTGVFHTVWKKQKDGNWKYVWD
jgi:ketosteroid isomerase-like protein